MLDQATRTNIVAFQGFNHVKWACYNCILPITKLGSDISSPVVDTEASYPLSAEFLLESHRALLVSNIPTILSAERSASNPENLILGLFVFWTSEPAPLVARMRQRRELRNGMITSDMLRNLSASDMDALFSGDDSKEPVVVGVPLQSSSFLLATPNRRDLSELELFLIAIRNLLARNLLAKGSVPLGKLYISATSKPDEKGDDSALTFDMWFASSSLFLRANLRSHNYVSAFQAPELLELGANILASPHGSPGLFRGFLQDADSRKEVELINVWSQRVGVSSQTLFPGFDDSQGSSTKARPPWFCLIQMPNSNYTLIYPSCFIFFLKPKPIKAAVLSGQAGRDFSVLRLLSSMITDATVAQSESEPFWVDKPELKPRKAVEPSEPAYTPIIESAPTGELDRWLFSLAQSQQRLGLDDLHCGNGDFTSPAHPLPGLTPGHANGTDPTPPTDSELGADSEFLGGGRDFDFNNDTFNTDFVMEDFDSFQINDADFSYFDPVEPKASAHAPGLVDTPISLPEPTVAVQPTCPSPARPEPLAAEPSPVKPSGKRKRDEVMTKVVSRNPWVPKNFQPIPGLFIGNPFLFRGKFSVLSNDLTQRVRPQFPSATTKYSADYCPSKRRRVSAPTCAPPVTVAKSHEEEPSQGAMLSSSDSDSSSDSEASCTDESASPCNATPAFIAPDIALSLPSHPQTSYSPPFVPASTSPLWRDPAVTRLFMDQLRTYPQASNTSPVAPPKSSSKLWNHIVSLSRSLLGLFSSRAENKEGPLTLQDCCQPSFGSHSGREAQDPSPITWAPPAKIQAYITPSRLAEVNISSVTFWKELGLRPATGQRNASYICLTPKGPSGLEEMAGFMSAMRESYEACHLGKLMPMSFSRIDQGLCLIPLGANGYATTMENIAKLSAMLGAELAKMPPNTLPKNIILFYSPPESPSPSQAIWDIAACFRKLQIQVGNPAIISRIRFQIIPNQVVAQFYAQRLPLSFIPAMGLSIYSRLDKAAYSPAFALSQPPPAQVQYRLPRAQGKLFDYSETLHLSYSWGPAKDSVIAVWMDGRASVLDHCLLPITARAFSNEDFLVDQLWQATRRFQARYFNINPRIAVTKLGTMEAGELAAWKRSISHIPGSCVMAAGTSCDLELFEPTFAAPVDSSSNAALVVLSDLHLPHARNVVSRAVGIMRADLPSSQWVQVVLLADSFQITSPPLSLAISFRRVLAQLNDLAAFDSVMRFTIANPLVATTPRSTLASPAFPLPWRWIQDASAHLKVLQASIS